MKADIIERALALYQHVLPEQPVRLRYVPPQGRFSSFYAADVPRCVLCGARHTHGSGPNGLTGDRRDHRIGHCLGKEHLPKHLRHRAAEWEALRGRGYILVPEDA